MESVDQPASHSLLLSFVILRLRYWVISTAQAALRHWQFFVLSIILLVPIGTPLRSVFIAIASPLLQVVHEGQGVWYHFWRLCTIQALALIWIVIQRNAVTGGSFMAYARSLPLTLAQCRAADITVLLASNTLLLAPLIAMFSLGLGLTFWHGFATAMESLVFTTLVLLMQLGFLESRGSAAIHILGADFVLSLGLSEHSAIPLWMALLVAVAFGVSSLTFSSNRRYRAVSPKIAFYGLGPLLRTIPPVRRIQIKILMSQGSTAVRFLVLTGFVLGSDLLMAAFRFDARVLPTLVVTLSVIALVISGFYRTLHNAHMSMSRYTHALPLPQRFWAWQDHVFVAFIGMLPLGPLLWLPLAHIPAIGFVLALVVGYFLLLVGLRLPVIHGGRQALLLAFLMVASWSGVALAMIP